ncbi:MAG: EAL domain-containing protein, partial [Proteobacteria bacterium]
IVIACSKKQDRLTFFNFFDELNVEKILTASDFSQMTELLAADGSAVDLLAVEVSSQWIKSMQQLEQLRIDFPDLKIIGLVADDIRFNYPEYQQIKQWVAELVYSPLTHNQLVATAALFDVNKSIDSELDCYLQGPFQVGSLPLLLVQAKNHHIVQVNENFLQYFKVYKEQIIGQPWTDYLALEQQQKIDQYQTSLNESGRLEIQSKWSINSQSYPVKLCAFYLNFNGVPHYLIELHDQSDHVFQQKMLYFLDKIRAVDFVSKRSSELLKQMVLWADFDFCFMLTKSRGQTYNNILFDFSNSQYAEHFIESRHDFIFRKLKDVRILSLSEQASEHIPGDEFITKNNVESIMVFNSRVNKQHQAILVLGGQRTYQRWNHLKLLFSKLVEHYRASMAFKLLKQSHESESQYDVLTNLMNRRYIIKYIEKSIEKAAQTKQSLAVIFLDLDRFKVINDSLGHDVGDQVLVNVAKILNDHVQDYGVAARYAGDEFLMLLNRHVTTDSVKEVANNILKTVAEPVTLTDGSEIKITISLGIALYPDHGKMVNSLIKHADVALYDAKLNGKNQYSIYRTELDGEQAKQSEEMVKSLEQAIESDQIDVYYQPKIDAKSEDIVGFEALVRWQHPELGVISPGLFVPLAEQSGLIHKIGLLVIEKSARSLKKWQTNYDLPLTMSVNLSPIQLNDNRLIDRIRYVLNQTKIQPKHLDFEITESEKFKSVKDALVMFKRIVELGCTLSIDDFGTGHSTLDYLRKIPAKTLKIDQVFVKNIGLSPDDEAILDATIDMAKRVGHVIVAEGVETELQRQYLSQKGCDYFQGYLFSRPLPAAQIEKILDQRAQILKNH